MTSVAELFARSFPDADGRWAAAGVDVSGNQQETVIADLHAAGVEFGWAVVKASEGSTYRSAEAARQVADARALGLPVGVYHWVSYGTSPLAEADNLSVMLDRLAVTKPAGPLPAAVWLDAEDPNTDRHRVPGGYDAYTADIADIIRARFDAPVGVYSARWWADGRLSARCGALPLWVADYDDGRPWPGYRSPQVPDAWAGQQPALWQWTSLTGELGHLDLNMAASDPTPPPESTGGQMAVTVHHPAHRPGGFNGRDVCDFWLPGPVNLGRTRVGTDLVIMPVEPGDAISEPLTVDVHLTGDSDSAVVTIDVHPHASTFTIPWSGRVSVVSDPARPITCFAREVHYDI